MKTNFGKIITIVGLVAIVATFVISAIQFCVKGVSVNWTLLTMLACCYTCTLTGISIKNKKTEK